MEAAEWISESLEPGEVLLEGGLLHQYAWVYRRGVVWIPLGSMADLFDIAARYGATYLAVTPEALRFRPALGDHWRVEGARIDPVAVPSRLLPVFDRRDSGVIIYRIEDPVQAPRDSGKPDVRANGGS